MVEKANFYFRGSDLLLVLFGGITCAIIFPMGLVLKSGGNNPLVDSAVNSTSTSTSTTTSSSSSTSSSTTTSSSTSTSTHTSTTASTSIITSSSTTITTTTTTTTHLCISGWVCQTNTNDYGCDVVPRMRIHTIPERFLLVNCIALQCQAAP